MILHAAPENRIAYYKKVTYLVFAKTPKQEP